MTSRKPNKTEKRLELRLIYRRAKYVLAFMAVVSMVVVFVLILRVIVKEVILVF